MKGAGAGRRLLYLLGGATAILALWSAPAHAAIRYASPTSFDTAGTCNPSPCRIDHAINAAANGDEVIIEPGDYGSAASPITTALNPGATSNVTIHGVADQPLPRIFTNASGNEGGALAAFSTTDDVRRLDIEYSGSGAGLAWAGRTAEGLVVHSTGTGSACKLLVGSSVLRDSSCVSEGANTFGVLAYNPGSPAPGTLSLRNVTAWASGSGGVGIKLDASVGLAMTNHLQLGVTNTIAHGAAFDVFARSLPDASHSAAVVLDHSNYATVEPDANGGTVTAPGTGTNQTTAPLLANPPSDVHELACSPTVDAGVTDALNGSLDFDGDARTLGASTDIGADEATVACHPPHTLTVNVTGAGSGIVTGPGINCGFGASDCSESYPEGTSVTLTATPASGSTFAGWSGGGCSGTGACTFSVGADTTVTGSFTPPAPPQFNLSVSESGTGSGTVASSPAGIDCRATCSAPFDQGTGVTLTATPSSGSRFKGFSGGGCSGTGPCTVTMNADIAVTARFTARPNTKISQAKIDQAKNSATFKFKSLGGGKAKARSGFQCALLKKKHAKPKWKRCSSPKRYKHLKPHRYTFEVRAFGAAGKDPTPAKKKFRIKP